MFSVVVLGLNWNWIMSLELNNLCLFSFALQKYFNNRHFGNLFDNSGFTSTFNIPDCCHRMSFQCHLMNWNRYIASVYIISLYCFVLSSTTLCYHTTFFFSTLHFLQLLPLHPDSNFRTFVFFSFFLLLLFLIPWTHFFKAEMYQSYSAAL